MEEEEVVMMIITMLGVLKMDFIWTLTSIMENH